MVTSQMRKQMSSTPLSVVVLVALLSATGCFSQQRNNAQGGDAQANGNAGARLVKSSWTAAGVSWNGGKTAGVQDPGLGEQAFTIAVPTNWRFKGLILRPHSCYAPSVPADGLSYTVLAPDGYTAVGQLPGASWTWKSDGTSLIPKCAPIPIKSATAFLLDIAVPNIHPFATKVTVVPPTPQMQQNLRNAQQQALQSSIAPTRNLVDTGRVRIEYMLGDQPMEEMLFTMMNCLETAMPGYPAMHRPATTQRSCYAHGVVFRRAPKGQLDALLATQPPPPHIDQAWDEHVSQNMRAVFAQYQAASQRQFAAIQDHFKQVTDNMVAQGKAFQAQQRNSFEHAMANDRAAQDATDHAAHLQVLDSLNRQDFIDPTTGQKIETSNQYTHNWISSDKNSVVLGADPTFDPNGVVDPVRESWTELIPID